MRVLSGLAKGELHRGIQLFMNDMKGSVRMISRN